MKRTIDPKMSLFAAVAFSLVAILAWVTAERSRSELIYPAAMTIVALLWFFVAFKARKQNR